MSKALFILLILTWEWHPAASSAESKNKASYNAEPILRGVGMERALITLIAAGAVVVAMFFWPLPAPARPMEIAAGFTYSQRQAEYLGIPWQEAFRAATRLRSGLVRLGAYWDEIEPRPGEYNFSRLDWLINEAETGGQRVLLTVGMKAPRWPEYFIPRWLERRLDVPHGGVVSRDLELRRRTLAFVERVVSRYADRPVIEAWQVENEPLDPSGPKQWRLGGDFLEREISAVRRLDWYNRPIVVNLFVAVDPLSFLLPLDDRAETILRSADILGLDAYPIVGKRFLGVDFYLNWNGWAWERTLQRYAQLAAERGKTAWIVEAQAEPWEPGRVVNTARTPSPSLGPAGAAAIAARLRAVGFSPILLWGVEHWYMRKLVHGDSRWWQTASDLLAESG
ncbi:MAG: beta-galactosidase [Chloroflexi bacterium]|nr:beta-galactosidase [Chloroflexota bacterium]